MEVIDDIMNLEFYLVRNKEGKYFRAKGFNGSGESWVTDIKKARIYQKIGPARASVTFFANSYPQYGIPDIIKIIPGSITIVDDGDRVNKAVAKKKKEKEEYEMRQAKWRLEEAQRKFQQAQADLARERKKLGK